jgi:hypothetical protein
MSYIPNPKFQGSGILGCIPQTGRCPNGCEDCFFQSGRSYLEPLSENLPNMPDVVDTYGRVVRVNDGNDSNVNRKLVMDSVRGYPDVFFNTAIPKDLEGFNAPVVLTLNPGDMTDKDWHMVHPIPKNLMMVRFRINTWNIALADDAIKYYTEREVPVVLTFMAYETLKPLMSENHYIHRKRILNEYYAIRTDIWRDIMNRYKDNYFVHSCGKIEGEKGKTGCRYCGNCLREYYATLERMRN